MSDEKLKQIAVNVDRTRDLQIFSLTLSQLSYPRLLYCVSNQELNHPKLAGVFMLV